MLGCTRWDILGQFLICVTYLNWHGAEFWRVALVLRCSKASGRGACSWQWQLESWQFHSIGTYSDKVWQSRQDLVSLAICLLLWCHGEDSCSRRVFHELPTVFFHFFFYKCVSFPLFSPVFHHFPFNCRLVSTCFHCFGRMSPRQQRLRDSVAPGPGTIVFVNPQDHPGIGTPGGTKSTGYLRLS